MDCIPLTILSELVGGSRQTDIVQLQSLGTAACRRLSHHRWVAGAVVEEGKPRPSAVVDADSGGGSGGVVGRSGSSRRRVAAITGGATGAVRQAEVVQRQSITARHCHQLGGAAVAELYGW